MNSLAYQFIADHYGDRTAKRSGIPLINHIDEGVELLEASGADEMVVDAFCLHPLFQDKEVFNTILRKNTPNLSTLPVQCVILAVEYRTIANGYLPKDYRTATDKIRLSDVPEVNLMLLADKFQNQRAFRATKDLYPNADILEKYFVRWIELLVPELARSDTDIAEQCATMLNVMESYDAAT